MNRIDWGSVEEVFHRALELPESERDAFVASQPSAVSTAVMRLLRHSNGEARIARAIQGVATLATQPAGQQWSMMGAYKLVREIGSGGMGTVYLAVRSDDQFQKQVAIKLIRRGMDTDELLSRFRQERQILANLEHPYIARFLDGGAAPDGRPFLVMEYLQGQPLDVYCREKDLDIAARLRLFLKVCEAVAFAHRNLVVHRDLKPGNILIASDGSPRLLDFGMAKLLHPEAASGVTQTFSASRPMTPDYASPEQFLGSAITTAADVYSLGAILFTLLADRAPHRFSSTSFSEMERVICHEEPPRASEAGGRWQRQIRGDLDAIAAKAMRKEPAGRYASVDLFVADVERYLDGRPVLARQGNFQYRSRKFLRRHRVAIAVGALFAVTLIVGATVAAIQARRAGRERLNALVSQRAAEVSRQDARKEADDAVRERTIAQAQRQRAEMAGTAAETQRQLADRRFDQVRQLAGKFLLEFNDAIVNLPGSTSARKMVVETGLRYFDTLVPEAGGDRGLLEEVARGYDRLGDVQGNPYSANVGDFAGALKTYRKAQAIRARIADPSPAFLSDRIGGNLRIAEWMLGRADTKGAEAVLQDAFAMVRGPAANDPAVRGNLASIYVRRGDVEMWRGTYAAAVGYFSRALEIRTGLAHDNNDLGNQTGLSLSHTKMADSLSKVGKPDEALVHMRAALAIDLPISKADPNNLTRLRKVFVDYLISCNIYLADEGTNLPAAEIPDVFEGAARLADQMAAADPNDLRPITDIRQAQSAWGDFLRDHNDGEGSLVHYRRALEAAQKQIAVGGQSAGAQDALLMSHHRLARGFIVAGKPEEALLHLNLAQEFLSTAERLGPDDVSWLQWRANLQRARGLALSGLKRWVDAVASYKAEMATIEQILKRDPATPFALDLRTAYLEIADCYAALGQWPDAISAMQNALDRFQPIAAQGKLPADEEQSRAAGAAKLAGWKQKAGI